MRNLAPEDQDDLARGIRNYDGEGARIAGLVLNLREHEPDLEAIDRFAREVRLPILATLPRSRVIRQAEQRGKTLIEAFPESAEARVFDELARHLLGTLDFFPARPLTEESLERLVLSRKAPARDHEASPPDTHRGEPSSPRRIDDPAPPPRRTSYIRTKLPTPTPYYYRKPPMRAPVQGCAYTGAVTLTTQIRDAVTVSHGPRSCAHMNRHYLHNGAQRARLHHHSVLPEKLAPALVSTDMDEGSMVYGGNERLFATLRQVLSARPKAVFVVPYATWLEGIREHFIARIPPPVQDDRCENSSP
jgi:nitrogenase iron protein NifH